MATVLVSASRTILLNACVRLRNHGITASKHRIHHSTVQLSEKWQLMSAVLLQRNAKISKDKNKVEKDFAELMSQLELENSSLSDHELRHKEDLKWAEKRKQEDFEETEADATRQTSLEAEDFWEDELKAFTPASRVTDADRSKDERSLDRCLDRQLVLVVNQKLGDSYSWSLPSGPHRNGESMRQTAERVLKETCGEDIKGNFIGNAPVGFLKYKYPPKQQQDLGFIGAKVFFFRAWHNAGNVLPNEKCISDYKWTTNDELYALIPPNYHRLLKKFVMEL